MSADQYRRTTSEDLANLRCPECSTVDGKDIWVVIDQDGFPEFAASVESYCHDHINDALLHKDKDAAQWVVRRFRQVYFDPTKRAAPETHPEYCKCSFTDADGTVVPGEPCPLHLQSEFHR